MNKNGSDEPNLPAMAIVFTAALIFAFLIFGALHMVFEDELGLEKRIAMRSAGGVAVLWVIFAAFKIGRSPNYRQGPALSEQVFHWWQVGVLAVILVFSLLQGSASSPHTMWAAAAVEFVLVVFYLCYIGFAFALRRRLPMASYLGLIVVVASCILAVWKAPK
jgi:hypothetical protein